MIPEWMPVFTTDDILTPPAKEYEDGDRRTTVGWLKHLFLWRVEGDYLITNDKDKDDYRKALSEFRSVNNIPKYTTLEFWEDEASPAQQKAALNKFRKRRGYIYEEYR